MSSYKYGKPYYENMKKEEIEIMSLKECLDKIELLSTEVLTPGKDSPYINSDEIDVNDRKIDDVKKIVQHAKKLINEQDVKPANDK